MTPVYKTTDDLLSDYNSLPEIEQNRVGKYLKNLVRIHKAIASLNFADRQVNWELSKQRIEPYTEAEVLAYAARCCKRKLTKNKVRITDGRFAKCRNTAHFLA